MLSPHPPPSPSDIVWAKKLSSHNYYVPPINVPTCVIDVWSIGHLSHKVSQSCTVKSRTSRCGEGGVG